MNQISLIIILILSSTKLFCQFGINPIIVNRIHSDELPFIGTEYVSWVHAIGGGLEVYKERFPFSFSFTKDYYYSLENFNPITQVRADDIDERWEESFYMLYYRFNKSYVGAGFFQMTREASLNLRSNFFAREFSGVILSYTQSLKWLDIEYKSKINLSDGFAAILGTNSHSISFNFRISNYERNLRNASLSKFEKKYDLLINLGARLFNASDIEVLPYEKEYGFSFKPAIGIEFINLKSNFGLFVEKDIWMSFNAGSNFREIKDQIIGNSFGIRYRIESKKINTLSLSLGLNFIRDSEVKRSLHGEKVSLHKKFVVNQARGILLGINYQIFKNTDLEVRHTIPYISRTGKIFEAKYFSIGLNYRLDPLL